MLEESMRTGYSTVPEHDWRLVASSGSREVWVYFHTDGSNTDWGWKFEVTPFFEAAGLPAGWELAPNDAEVRAG